MHGDKREYIPRSSGHWHWLRRRGMWVPIVIIAYKIKVEWWDKRREGQSEVSECSDELYSRIARYDHEYTLEWLDCDQRGPRVSTLTKQERITTNKKTRARETTYTAHHNDYACAFGHEFVAINCDHLWKNQAYGIFYETRAYFISSTIELTRVKVYIPVTCFAVELQRFAIAPHHQQ